MPDLAFKLLAKEPLVAVLRSDHRLAALEAMSPQDLVGETFISVPETFAPTLRVVIDDYLKNRASTLRPITK
jgi:LysR family hca operon transcriptional activator